MSTAQVVLKIFQEFKSKKLLLWLFVLVISAAGPLIGTYIFSRGVSALETHQTLEKVLLIFVLLTVVTALEIFLRVRAKTKIHYYTEFSLMRLQIELVKFFKPRARNRKKGIQSVRNLQRAIQTFMTYFINNGVAGVVSFISVPFILYFVDKRIFMVELSLIVIYMTITYFFSKRYEHQYELYDESRERFYSKLSSTNKVGHRGRTMAIKMKNLQNLRFFEWLTLQNLIGIFQFIIAAIIVVDIINGFKGIADLVLIIGYTKESQKFLNSVTSDLNRYMQVHAGIDRLVITSEGGSDDSILSLL